MNLDRRAVKAYHLYIDLDDSLRLKRGKHSAEHSVSHADVSTLSREILRYLFVLLLRYLHVSIIPDSRLLPMA